MTPEQIRLECLKLVWPKDMPEADEDHFIGKAKALYDYVTSAAPKKRGRPPKSDKPQGPDGSV